MAKASGHLTSLDQQLKDSIAPLLDETGFSRSGRTRLWLRPSTTGKEIHHLVWFQIGESASSQAGRFTVELGLYYPKYDRFCNGRELFGPGIAACHFDLRKRLGFLLAKPEDKWWPYNDGEEQLMKQMADVKKLLVNKGLAWFDEADTPANAATYNTGKLPEPDRLRREAREQALAAKKK